MTQLAATFLNDDDRCCITARFSFPFCSFFSFVFAHSFVSAVSLYLFWLSFRNDIRFFSFSTIPASTISKKRVRKTSQLVIITYGTHRVTGPIKERIVDPA